MIWHSTTTEEVVKELSVDPEKGLLSGVAEDRLSIYGENTTGNRKKISFSKCFLNQLNNKWFYILLAVLVISTVTSAIYGNFNIFSPLLIVAILVIDALVGAFYKYKSECALDKISNIMQQSVTVLRDGLKKQIPSVSLVPGDILLLNEGDYITADARLIECTNFRCNENAVTGENVPIEKIAGTVVEDIATVNSRVNMVFSGASVLTGSAKAVVVETGINTEFGKSFNITEVTNSDELPIKSTLNTAGNIINIAVLVLCGIAFVIGVLRNIHTPEPFASMTLDMLTTALALGIAAIPESLPAISTVVVALGIERILHDNIIIKRTKALEYLGKTNVICADKTGILTKNTMHLNRIYDGSDTTVLNGEKLSDKSAMALRLAVLCSSLTGDPTEAAIEAAANEYNKETKYDIENIFPHLSDIPFDTARKTMTSVNMINNVPLAIVKGAPESIINKCVDIDTEEISQISMDMATEGLRVLCVAVKQLEGIPANPNPDEIECDLTFVALLGIKDPPRTGAVNGIKICDDAGIRTVMMTGDSVETATAVAKQIGILKDDTTVISGEQLNAITDDELYENIENYSVFARITPSDKIRIIKAWQSKGKIVTVTGDNIEDGDALNAADIGCAMGKRGTDVAKGNADIVIEENNFISLVNAIKESRGLFDNIKKSITYLLSCNLSEILMFIIGIAIFAFPPLLAVQLLWINLLTDCAPAISLATEKAHDGIMKKKQIAIRGKIFDFANIISIVTNGFFLTFIALICFIIGNSRSPETGMTMAFLCVSVSQILHSFNMKTEDSILKADFKSNKFMNYTSILVIFVAMFLSLTPAGYVFGLTVLSAGKFFITLLLSILIIPFSELIKFLLRKFSIE